MADKFLYHGGSNTAPYETPATAATTLAGLLAGTTVAAGEKIWVKSDHLEQTGAAVTLTSEGATASAPLQLFCTDEWTSTPATLATGAIISTSGTSSYSLTLSGFWNMYGITLSANYLTSGQGAIILGDTNGPHRIILNSCTLLASAVQSSSSISTNAALASGTDTMLLEFIDVKLFFRHASQGLRIASMSKVLIDNLSLDSGSTVPSALIYVAAQSVSLVELSNSDFSSYAISNIVTPGANGCIIKINNCKFPSGATVLSGDFTQPGGGVLIINCDSGDTYTRHELHGYEGVWSVAPTIYATTTPADMSAGTGDSYSIKMAASANVSKHLPLYSQWMQVWNDGTSYTPSIEVLVGADGATALTVNEMWLEVDYNSGTDSPLGTRVTTQPGLLDASTTAVAAGTTAWTGDGYTTERTHKLSTAAITPDKPGWIYMRVALAKPSTTIYVNPPR